MMSRSKIEEFFNRIALFSGISDTKTIRSVYYGLVKVISSELIKGIPIEMPEFGVFKINIRKEHMGVNISTGEKTLKKRSAVLRFKPCRSIKLWCQDARVDSFLRKET